MTKSEKKIYKNFKKRIKYKLNNAKKEYREACKRFKRRLKEYS